MICESGQPKNTSLTDWERLAAMTDDEIDYTDISPFTDAFFERAQLRIPVDQAQDWIKLDPEIVRWFSDRGEGYKDRILAVLRDHMRTQG